MEIEKEITKRKELQSLVINYIDDDDEDINFQSLAQFITESNFSKNISNLRDLLHLLSIIANNHYRGINFFNKITQIINYVYSDVQALLSNQEIYEIFHKNSAFTLHLISNKIIILTDDIISSIKKDQTTNLSIHKRVMSPYHLLFLYLYYGSNKDNQEQDKIKKEITKSYHIDFDTFQKLCQNGENELQICDLIRHDSLNEFITYINETNVKLDIDIPISKFETNELLLTQPSKLIEYSAFFGSIQIFKYLQMNKVKMRPIILDFAVHGRNSEIIHLIEENEENFVKHEIQYPYLVNSFRPFNNLRLRFDNPPISSLFESIRCHHNDIANYLEQNLCEIDENLEKKIISHSVNDYNYEFIPDDFNALFPLPKSQFDYILNKKKNAYSAFYSITKITLPSSLTEIANFCFYLFSNLKEIIITDSVKSIGSNSFQKCKSLEQISFSNSSLLNSIGESAFAECSSLKKIIIPSSLTEISADSFKGCSSLEEITFTSPSSLNSIGESAFAECSSLQQIMIPSSVNSIAQECFKLCSSLTEVLFETHSSLKSIENRVFEQCSNLKKIIFPPSVTSIGDYAFKNCLSLFEIEIPLFVTIIKMGVFENCSSLEQITIPSSIIKIENYAFQYCSSLIELSIPSSVTSIGDYSFRKCTSLIRVTIPSSVTEIGKGSFENCSSLKQITLPSSITVIKDFAFKECTSLAEFNMQSSVVSIGKSSFKKCSSLKQISIPSSVISIDNDAFSECSSLSEVVIDSSITKISDSMFYKCESLKKIKIPSSVTEIGSLSFYKCSSLENIEITSSISKIGDFAFAGCNLLQQSALPKDPNNKDEIQIYILKSKEIYLEILNFLDSKEDDINEHLLNLIREKSEDQYDLIELLNLLSRISDRYYNCSFEKIEKILNICKERMKEKLTNNKICHIFKENKRILLFLIENEIINLDISIANIITNLNSKEGNSNNNVIFKETMFEYFKPELMKIGYKIKSNSDQLPDDFNEKRKIGQNDNEICRIIRNDSINEFIQYFNNREKTEINDSQIIPNSIFETKSILMNNTSYIEYAAFYGSIKIFNYLFNNDLYIQISNNQDYDYNDYQITLNRKAQNKEFIRRKKQYLWYYAAQGNQSEIIHILEENDIKPEVNNDQFNHYAYYYYDDDDINYIYENFNIKNCFEIAIKCHNNKIAKYIINDSDLSNDYLSALKYSNFLFIDDFYNNFNEKNALLLYNLCLYDFPKFAQVFMKSKNIDLNSFKEEFEINDNSTLRYRDEFTKVSDTNKIIQASIQSNNEIIKFLLEGQQNISFDEESLFSAISNENIENVKIILSNDPNLNVNKTLYIKTLFVEEYLNQVSPLFLAIINKNIEVVKLLLEHPNINVNLSFEPKSGRTTYRTALHIAIILNDIEIVKLLLNQPNIDVNALANFDETTYGFLNWSKANHFDHYYTPLHEAVELENIEIIKLLLNHSDVLVNKIEIYDNYENAGKDCFDRVRQTALCRAIQKQNFEIVKLLLENENIDVNILAVYHQNDTHDPYLNGIIIREEDGVDVREVEFDDDDDDESRLIIKRNALQFAYAGKSKDIIQLLLNRNDLENKNMKVDDNDNLIKKFTRDIT